MFCKAGHFRKTFQRRAAASALAICMTLSAAMPAAGSAPDVDTEQNYICGKVEHQHSDACYERVEGEVSFVCSLPEGTLHRHEGLCFDKDGNLTCPLPEVEPHTHTEDCYQTVSTLTCGMEEGEGGHTHTDACYEEQETLVCGQEESERHIHTDACYEETQSLVCGNEDPEHIHGEECWQTKQVLTCGEEETEGHTHGPDCWAAERVLTCGQEEAELHTHTADCYEETTELVCDLPETDPDAEYHVHTQECLETADGELRLVCGMEEHTHTEDCLPPEVSQAEEKEWKCGQAEHSHGLDCYDENGDLTCELTEHIHDDGCLAEPAPQVPSVPLGPETMMPEWKCGLQEHTHDNTCYDELGELTCDLPEHSHTVVCLAEPIQTIADAGASLRIRLYDGSLFTSLNGAEYAVLDAPDATDALFTVTDNGAGEYIFNNLESDTTYYVKQTLTPESELTMADGSAVQYKLDENVYPLTVSAEGIASLDGIDAEADGSYVFYNVADALVPNGLGARVTDAGILPDGSDDTIFWTQAFFEFNEAETGSLTEIVGIRIRLNDDTGLWEFVRDSRGNLETETIPVRYLNCDDFSELWDSNSAEQIKSATSYYHMSGLFADLGLRHGEGVLFYFPEAWADGTEDFLLSNGDYTGGIWVGLQEEGSNQIAQKFGGAGGGYVFSQVPRPVKGPRLAKGPYPIQFQRFATHPSGPSVTPGGCSQTAL